MNKGLPVKGYLNQSNEKIDLVNSNKIDEERILRKIDELLLDGDADMRWLSIARTNIEQGFMAMNRAIFKPARIEVDDA